MRFVLVRKSTAVKVLLLIIVAVIAFCGCYYTGSAVVWQNKTVRSLPIYRVGTEDKVVALSFDAAWGADNTLKILDTLTDYDIKANFFVVGFWAEKYADKLKTLSESGRVEIGTHSNTHPHMSKLSKEAIRPELTTSMSLIEEITGVRPELFRAPFGDYNDTLIDTAKEEGLFTIQWDVDSLDWKNLSASDIAVRVLKGVRGGSIVLMHNDGKHTLEALPLVIEGLKNKGFTFKTIGEMIYRENFTIAHDGTQIRS